jgi:hypothetical protein
MNALVVVAELTRGSPSSYRIAQVLLVCFALSTFGFSTDSLSSLGIVDCKPLSFAPRKHNIFGIFIIAEAEEHRVP